MLILAECALILLWVRMVAFWILGMCSWARARAGTEGRPPPDRISLVVPALNEARDIAATLASLRAQEPQPWEIIVIDDGSTDGTAEIARRSLAGADRMAVVELAVNRGKAEALNVGIALASGDLVATIDADTLLTPTALANAQATLRLRQVDAVALYVDVENPRSMLERLQQQEYVAGLNFERAAQDAIGAIAILPGAATLFTRQLLVVRPFSDRTRTEDADLTLSLSRTGARLAVASGATAATVVPATWRNLLVQRTRWMAGHLQCCARHATWRGSDGGRFRLLVFPNFVLSTLAAPIGLAALGALMAMGQTTILHLSWMDAAMVSLALSYGQRGTAWLIAGSRRSGLRAFILEPWFSNAVGTVCFVAAAWSLAWPPVWRHPGPR